MLYTTKIANNAVHSAAGNSAHSDPRMLLKDRVRMIFKFLLEHGRSASRHVHLGLDIACSKYWIYTLHCCS